MNGYAIQNGRGAVKEPLPEPLASPQRSLTAVWKPPNRVAIAARGGKPEMGGRFARQSLFSLAQMTVPIAKRLLPTVTQTLIRVIPPETTIATPASILSRLLYKGEVQAAQQEVQFFGTTAAITIGRSIAAHHAVLTEVLAAEASHTPSASEAAALIGTVIPIAIGSLESGIVRRLFSGSSLRRVLSTLLVATAHLVRLLHRCGSAARRLIRLIPTILRRIVASLRAARQLGYPVTPALVGRTMVAHTARVLGNSQLVISAIVRNVIFRQRTVAAPTRFLNHV